jgi:hypothetical protein
MLSKSINSFSLIQGILIFIRLVYSDKVIFVSDKIYERNCLGKGINCDGSSQEKPTKNFFTAMSLLINNCSTTMNSTTEIKRVFDIRFLEDEQDAGDISEPIVYSLSNLCPGINLTLKGNLNISIIRFSSINFLIKVPYYFSISRVQLIMGPNLSNIYGKNKASFSFFQLNFFYFS